MTDEEIFFYKSLAIIFFVPFGVVLVVPVLFYLIALPFILIGSCRGDSGYWKNFKFYSAWFIGLFFKPPR